MQDKLTTTYSVGYDQESETTILHFENSNGTGLTIQLPELEVNRLIRLLEAVIDKQESVI